MLWVKVVRVVVLVLISTSDFREALCFESISANSVDFPLRGRVMDSPSAGSSRGFHTGDPEINKQQK